MSPNRVGGRAHEIHDAKETCTESGAPMRRMGFEQNQRRDTVFTYKCEKCESTMKKTLKRAWSRRRRE